MDRVHDSPARHHRRRNRPFLAGWSVGVRAVVQIYSVGLETPRIIRAGSVVTARVSTAGRTYVDARIDLEQGKTVEQLGFMRITSNNLSSNDFRPKRVVFDGRIPEDVLARFKAGQVQLRVTAEGHSRRGSTFRRRKCRSLQSSCDDPKRSKNRGNTSQARRTRDKSKSRRNGALRHRRREGVRGFSRDHQVDGQGNRQGP